MEEGKIAITKASPKNLPSLDSRDMEARREFPQEPQVQLKQTFWVTEDSMAKLWSAGARCVDAVTQTHRYYDTASDDLAMAGLWLSRRDEEWFLIVESQEEETQETQEEQDEEKVEPSFQKMTKNVQWDNALVDRKPPKRKIEEEEPPLKIQHPQRDSNAGPKVTSAFAELVGEREVAAYLAAHLRLDLKTEERENVPMEDFLQKAGLEHYASNHVVNRATYLLSDRYTVTVLREEGSLRETATVSVTVNVFEVCKGLEEIEKLAAYLGFEQQGVPSEREVLTENREWNEME